MKKLITIITLTFSIGAWSEITYMKCEYESFFDYTTNTFVDSISTPVSLVIDTATKRIQMSDYTINSSYREQGASILWNTMFTIRDGTELLMRHRRELDRITGAYTMTFEDAKVPPVVLEDLTVNMVEKFHEELIWEPMSATNFQCYKTEPLF